MKYKLLATDLDGTFLDNKSRIPVSNKLAVNQLIKNGVKFVIVTGRAMFSVTDYINELESGGVNYAIFLNGAEIRELSSNKIIFEKRLEQNIAQIIRQECRKFDVEVITFISDVLYFDNIRKNIKNYISYSPQYEILPIDAPLPSDVSKVLVIGDNLVLKEFEKHINDILKDSVNMFYSNSNYLEFTNREIDKGAAVLILSKMLDIQIGEVICVGDNFNDSSMLKVAGMSVAPSNAEPEIKRFVKYVAKSSNDDGVIKEIAQTFFVNAAII